jgi:DNA-binding GntR family transcriptional regulator
VAAVEFQSKADVLTASLRELIITGEIDAGTPLRQRDIAERFGVSPTPVREALRRLEAEGLVQHDLHRGATVIDADIGSEEEAYQVRAVLESLAARMAAERATTEDLDQLRAAQERFASSAPGDASLVELNRQFHFRMYEAARSPMLLALLRLLWQTFRRSPQRLAPPEWSSADHEAILDALSRGDADAAEDLTRRHVLRALDDSVAEFS